MAAPIAPFWLGTKVVYDAGACTGFRGEVVGYTNRRVRVRYAVPENWRSVRLGRCVGGDPLLRESVVDPRNLSVVGHTVGGLNGGAE